MEKVIGIIGAMEEEILLIKNHINNLVEEEIASIKFYFGEIDNKKVVLTQSGIGKVNSAVTATLLIEKFNVSGIVFTGVAGGVNSDLNIGDIVVSTDLVQHDFDLTSFGRKMGEIPNIKSLSIFADKNLIEIANSSISEIGLNFVNGRIISGDQFINSKEKIKELRDVFNADAVEMEGASVAQVCYLFNTPFVVIRSISDKADDNSHVDFNEFVKIAADNSAKIVLKMMEKI